MTKREFKTKVRLLKKEVNKLIDEKTDKVLSGAIDLKSINDDFTIPKAFISACGKEIMFQFLPMGEHGKETEIIKLFINN